MTILTDIRADTSNILADWDETHTFQRSTAPISTAGEENLSWYTNLITNGDTQAIRVQRRAQIGRGGLEFSPEYQTFLRHGSDVIEGDRYTFDGFVLYVGAAIREEDKLQLLSARRMKDAT